MDATSLDKVARYSEGRLTAGDPTATVATVCTDWSQ